MVGQDKTIHEIEENLVKRIEELSYIVNGLENHGPFNKVIDMFKLTKQSIDDNWHLIADQNKLNELRITKYSTVSLINLVPNLKMDLLRLQKELIELQNPDEIIKKDYDEG